MSVSIQSLEMRITYEVYKLASDKGHSGMMGIKNHSMKLFILLLNIVCSYLHTEIIEW